MIAERLRKAVLQAAFEGRLTGQFSDENSIDKNVIKFENNNHLLFIPGTWKWMKMKEIIDVRDGTHDTPKYYKTGIPLVTSKNLNNGTIDFSTCKFISYEDYLNINRRSNVDDDDILFAMIGSIGNPVIVKKDREFSIKNMALFKKSDFVISKYLYYYLIYSDDTFKRNASGAVQSFVSLKYLRNFFIPVPSKEEQKRIVEKLEVLLTEINKLEQDEKALKDLEDKFPERLKNAIMLSAIQGNLTERITTKEESSLLKKKILDKKEKFIQKNIIRKEKQYPIEENEVLIIPNEWESIELADIVHFTKTIKKKTEDKLPYLDVKSLRSNEYSNFRTNGEVVEVGDYAILVDGQNSGEIFKISKRGYLGSTLRKILINPIIEHNYALLILDFYKNTFRDNKRGAAIPHLDFKIFNTSVVPLPSSIEQKRIVEKLDKLFAIDLLNI